MAVMNTFFHGELTGYEVTCLKSFVDHGHHIRFFSYEERLCPSFCEWADAERVLGKDKIYFYKNGPGKGSVAAFSNYFRYEILRQFDGYWIDTDLICLRPDWPDEPFVAGWEDEVRVNNAVLKIEKDHPALLAMSDECRKDLGEGEWGFTGPLLLTRMIRQFEIEHLVKETSLFYPIPWQEAGKLLLSAHERDIADRSQASAAVHIWGEIHRRRGVDKTKEPETGSFIWAAAHRHATLSAFRATG